MTLYTFHTSWSRKLPVPDGLIGIAALSKLAVAMFASFVGSSPVQSLHCQHETLIRTYITHGLTKIVISNISMSDLMQTPKTRFKIYINWFLCVFFLNNFNRLKFQSVQYLLYSFQLSVVQLQTSRWQGNCELFYAITATNGLSIR